jgi:hypothetical protein
VFTFSRKRVQLWMRVDEVTGARDMADEPQDVADYRDAIDGLLLDGETLEAVAPAALTTTPDTDAPRAVAITSHRLIVCYRQLKRGDADRWTFRSVPYGRIDEVELARTEKFHRDRIDSESTVSVYYRRDRGRDAAPLMFRYQDGAIAREVHDRITAHVLGIPTRQDGAEG